MKLQQIIKDWIGKNKNKNPSYSQVYDDLNWSIQGYNQCLADLRDKAPELEENIINTIQDFQEKRVEGIPIPDMKTQIINLLTSKE